MSKNKTKKYEGSEYELQAQIVELDELHHDVGMPAMAQALGAMRGTSRREIVLRYTFRRGPTPRSASPAPGQFVRRASRAPSMQE